MAFNEFLDLQLMKYNNLLTSQIPEKGDCDVIFEVGGKTIRAHKTMLISSSEIFASMLSERWTQNINEPIKIETYKFNDFCQFLIFIYSGECEITDENIFSMTDISEFYGIPLLKIHCHNYLTTIKITMDNIFLLMDTVDKFSMNQIKDRFRLFVEQNFIEIINSDEFLKMSKSVVEELVRNHKNQVKPKDLFLVIFDWAEKQAKNKQVEDPDIDLNGTIKDEISILLPHIYFNFMKPKFFGEFVEPQSFIFSSPDEWQKIINDRISHPLVKVKNTNDQTLYGNLMFPDKNIIENIQSLKSIPSNGNGIRSWWDTKFENIPPFSSQFNIRDGVKWYLIYNCNGLICVKRARRICKNDFLLAEMTVLGNGFDANNGCKIKIYEN